MSEKIIFPTAKNDIGIPWTSLEFPGQRWNSPDNFFAPFCPGNSNPSVVFSTTKKVGLVVLVRIQLSVWSNLLVISALRLSGKVLDKTKKEHSLNKN